MLAPALILLATAPAAASPPPPSWRWPVRGEVVERFVVGPDPYARGQHRGVDIAARRGAPVRAACAGRVRFAGRAGSFGRAVSVACGGFVVSYGHLATVATRRGATVAADSRIGTVGTTGAASSRTPHLHLGARRAADPHGYVDPLRFLPARRPASPPPGPVRVRPASPPLRPVPIPARPGLLPHAPSPARAPVTRPSPLPVPVLAGLVLLGAGVPGLALLGARRRGSRRRRPTPSRMPVAFRNSTR